MIIDVRLQLAALWIVRMLTYLLGDVLRIFSGDFKAGEIEGKKSNAGHVVGNCGLNGDSDSYGFPVHDIGLSGESLGQYHHSRILLLL